MMTCRKQVFKQHYREVSKMLALNLLLTLSLSSNVSCSDRSEPALSSWTSNEDSWNYWWSYSGVSGPSYWGLLNLDWFMCDKGRRQSPINIETSALVFDPNLTPLSVDNNLISGILYNDGHAIVFNATFFPSIEIKQKILDQAMNSESNEASISGKEINIGNNSGGGSISKRESINHDDSGANIFDLVSSNKLDPTSSFLGDSSHSRINMNNVEVDDNLDISADSNSILEDQNVLGSLQKFEHEEEKKVLISGAGLMYSYRFEALYLRFGNSEANSVGSEHQINSHSYAAEIQIMSYNSLLYKSYAEASSKPQGLLGIAIMVDLIRDEPESQANSASSRGEGNKRNLNEPLEVLLSKLDTIKHRGFSAEVRNFNLSALIPDTNSFVTYEGSLTIPSCDESVNWLVINKPLYISQSKLNRLRSLSAGEQSSTPTGTLISGNIRPIQPANNRPIRTNIKPQGKDQVTILSYAGKEAIFSRKFPDLFSSLNQNPVTCPRLWTRYEYKHSK